MSKFYAVKNGRNPGIYTSWPECEKNVKGFSGAIYKSFSKRVEAELFMSNQLTFVEKKEVFPEKKEVFPEKYPEKDVKTVIEIYTDGSHSKHESEGYLGFGAFCSYMGDEYLYSADCTDKLLTEYGIEPSTKLSNCTMEFLAFAELLRMIYEYKISNYIFVFKIDYEGVAKWISNIWKANKPYIKKIKERCDFLLKNIKAEIKIEHVPGHSNIYGNKRADQLAKSKIPINTFPKLFDILA